LITETRAVRRAISENLSHGYDRLLQWQTRHAGAAAAIRTEIEAADADQAQEAFWVKLLESLGMQMEELRPHRWMLQAGSPETESLPELPLEGLCGTFDRRDALEREEITFLTNDHPLLRGALDLLLGSDQGSASCAVLSGPPESGLVLEICYVLECIAPAALHADRFLPSLPIRVVVDHRGRDRSADNSLIQAKATTADAATTRTACAAVPQLDLAATAAVLAAHQQQKAIASALKKVHRILGTELKRLESLAATHGTVSNEEITALQSHQTALEKALGQARLRVDALRIGIIR
jgi:ATP-dependent helicase HepA